MKRIIPYLILLYLFEYSHAQSGYPYDSSGSVERRLRQYIDSLKIIDTHEHLLNPDLLRRSNLLDFFLLMNHYYYDDLISSGMPPELFDKLYNSNIPPKEKWKLIEPYWNRSFNTSFATIAKIAARGLYKVNSINEETVEILSQKIRTAYSNKEWFRIVLRDSCRIDYVIQDDDNLALNDEYIKYVKRFTPWLNIRSKYSIDSIAMEQVEPIFTLQDFVRSMKNAFEKELQKGMVGVKIITAYSRTLYFNNPEISAANKVFKTLITGEEDLQISLEKAKPLQDYMFHRLLEMAQEHNMPVIFHTGLQAGSGNDIRNSNPVLLVNIFQKYPKIKFVIFHGSYPYGGELSILAKTYRNVYIDLNWAYAISPSYAKRYLNEFLETVPVYKIMAFGGDYNCVENVYAEYQVAKKIIAEVLAEKVINNYFTEDEARRVARMILHDNAAELYGLP